jgi:hypothetical protein
MRDTLNWIVDPDHKQNRCNGEIITRPMTAEEREKYKDVKPSKKEPVYLLKDSDILRMLQNRGLRPVG